MEENKKVNNEELEAQVKQFVAEYLKKELEASKSSNGAETKVYPEDKNKYPKNVASLTLGIIAIVCNMLWYISLPTGILAIIFGKSGIKKTGSKAAKAGMICGIVGLSLCVVLYVTIILFYIAYELM